ncbi:ABC transporter [Penicillium herquei]|nr:ABC transporter [Penicillium herquei]
MKKRLKDLVAYVPQDDTLVANLTVRENILFSARIRIGNSCPAKDLENFVDSLISALGLHKVRHQLVGDIAKRGISGGERKRVNIGLELVAAPQILALDEPTSGLDAKTALDIMQLLKELAMNDILVICVIHQPRSEIFALLDDLLLLHAGQQMYFGDAAEASQYLDSSDKGSSPTQNSADAIMDALVSGRYHNNSPFTLERRVSTSLSQEVTKTSHPITKITVHSLLSSIQQLRAPWYRQLGLVFIRGIIQQGRETSSLSLEMVSGTITGLFIGLSNYEFRGHLFQGLFHSPFEPLSSAVAYRLLTQQALLSCLAIGKFCPRDNFSFPVIAEE